MALDHVMSENKLIRKTGLLVVLGFNSLGHIMAVGDAYVFPGFLTPVLTRLFFPKPLSTSLTSFCRGERQIHRKEKSP